MSSAQKLLLIHWNDDEARELAQSLREAGWAVDIEAEDGTRACHAVDEGDIDAVIVYLLRLPSHGRETARRLRERKKTHNVPIVFVDGAEKKVARVKQVVPDAVYTTSSKLIDTLGQLQAVNWTGARASEVGERARDREQERARSKPLADKLDLKPHSTVCLVNPPIEYFDEALTEVPEGVEFVETFDDSCDFVHLFVRGHSDLESNLDRLLGQVDSDVVIWVSWPKGTSSLTTDLRRERVRDLCLERGLVDTKVCSIDEDWSALKFSISDA